MLLVNLVETVSRNRPETVFFEKRHSNDGTTALLFEVSKELTDLRD